MVTGVFKFALFSEPDIDEHEKITCEYAPEKRRRSEILDDTFGKAVLPTLEKVEYRVSVSWARFDILFSPKNMWLLIRSAPVRQF